MSSKLRWEASDTMEMPSRPSEWEYPGKAKSSAFLRHPADHGMGNTQAHTVGVGLGTGVTGLSWGQQLCHHLLGQAGVQWTSALHPQPLLLVREKAWNQTRSLLQGAHTRCLRNSLVGW